MPTARVNGIELCYESTGEESGSAILLVAGLGMQLTGWPEEWSERLAGAGHYVIRFDNRDIGLSAHLVEDGKPDLLAWLGGRDPNVGYGLADMADDAAALLEHLGVESAHVVGISMGGMIAQVLAINHAPRVRTLCSIMSTTGDHAVGQPSAAAVTTMLRGAPETRAAAIDYAVEMFGVIGSPGYPSDEELDRERFAAAYDRDHDPDGVARQLGAILTSGDRTEALHQVSVPTLVIHGDSDPLVDVSGGEATARAIPGARLLLIEGMGHDLPAQLYDRLLDAILTHVSAADDMTATGAST